MRAREEEGFSRGGGALLTDSLCLQNMLGVQPGKRFLHRRHPVWGFLAREGERDEEAVLFQTKEKHEAGISSLVASTAPAKRTKFVEDGLCEYFGFSMFSCPPASN